MTKLLIILLFIVLYVVIARFCEVLKIVDEVSQELDEK
ncbi:hypothetical protein Cal7507_0158 [Calothrix sp. PCC 7507]|nr:hypothetical protein Cal7507_0158 [Calothrix sp. PCC 7507]